MPMAMRGSVRVGTSGGDLATMSGATAPVAPGRSTG